METPNVPETANAENTGSAPDEASMGSAPDQGSVNEPVVQYAEEPQQPQGDEKPTETPEGQEVETPEGNETVQNPETNVDPGSSPAGEEAKVSLSEHLKLRKRAQEAERRAAFYEGRASVTQQQPQAQPQTQQLPKEQAPPFTPLEDFQGSYEDWLSAKTRHELKWEQEQERKQAEQQQRQQAELEQNNTVQQAYSNRVAEASKTIPDLQETIDNAGAVLPTYDNKVVNAVKKSDMGPQIVYYLAKNPVDAANLAKLEPELAIMEIGSIREKAKAMFQQPKTKKVTTAPPPINPGNAAGTTVNVDLADKPVDDYFASRNNETFVKVGGRLVRKR